MQCILKKKKKKDWVQSGWVLSRNDQTVSSIKSAGCRFRSYRIRFFLLTSHKVPVWGLRLPNTSFVSKTSMKNSNSDTSCLRIENLSSVIFRNLFLMKSNILYWLWKGLFKRSIFPAVLHFLRQICVSRGSCERQDWWELIMEATFSNVIKTRSVTFCVAIVLYGARCGYFKIWEKYSCQEMICYTACERRSYSSK